MAQAYDNPGDLLDAYFARFGDTGDFDRWALPGEPSDELMAEALRRGQPVSLEDVKRKYQEVNGEPYPDDLPEGSVT
jgi:hypothetical protein